MHGADGVGVLLAMADEESGALAAYAYDGNGNVSRLYDLANGAVVGSYEYDPFGNTISQSGSFATVNPFRFSTKYLDESGLYYYGYRFYSASIGRWLNRDPIGEFGSFNLYVLNSNDSVKLIDYLGLSPMGHHLVPQALWKNYRATEAGKVFDSGDSRLDHPDYKSHGRHSYGGVSESVYRSEVDKKLNQFMIQNRITNISSMTEQQAKDFVKKILSESDSSLIGRYNNGVLKEIADDLSKCDFDTTANRQLTSGQLKTALVAFGVLSLAQTASASYEDRQDIARTLLYDVNAYRNARLQGNVEIASGKAIEIALGVTELTGEQVITPKVVLAGLESQFQAISITNPVVPAPPATPTGSAALGNRRYYNGQRQVLKNGQWVNATGNDWYLAK